MIRNLFCLFLSLFFVVPCLYSMEEQLPLSISFVAETKEKIMLTRAAYSQSSLLRFLARKAKEIRIDASVKVLEVLVNGLVTMQFTSLVRTPKKLYDALKPQLKTLSFKEVCRLCTLVHHFNVPFFREALMCHIIKKIKNDSKYEHKARTHLFLVIRQAYPSLLTVEQHTADSPAHSA